MLRNLLEDAAIRIYAAPRRLVAALALALVAGAVAVALLTAGPDAAAPLVEGEPSTTQVVQRGATQAPAQHFAKVEDGRVVRVEVVDEWFLRTNPDRYPGVWVETFPDGSSRGTYATAGSTYDAERDLFLPPRPFPSWSLDDQLTWQPPVPRPSDGARYLWDEASLTWQKQEAD